MTQGTVHFSLVVPLYESAPYLPDLLTSFAEQRPGGYEAEFIFVDDGSPDDSADIAQRWLDATGRAGQVLRQQNGGVSAARNAGLAVATGDWIGFPDGDDFVGADYLSSIASALAECNADPVLVSTNVKWYLETSNRVSNTHVLRFKFADGTRAVDLDEEPSYIQSQAASALFRRDVLDESAVRFIENLSIAEDALFVGEYLLRAPSRNILFVKEAEYFYRKRAAANSSVDTVHTNFDFYFHRFERGYLPLFERASAGGVPAWLDMMFLYDVRWFLPRESNINQKAVWMSASQKRRVLDALSAVLKHVDDSSIHRYNVTGLGVDHRCILLALKGSPLPAVGTAKVVASDHRGIEIRYLYRDTLPGESFSRDGGVLQPTAAKIRRLDVFDQRLVFERIVWLPAGGPVTLTLDGNAVELETSVYRAPEVEPLRKRSVGERPSAVRRFRRRLTARLRAEVAALLPWTYTSRPGTRGRGRRLRTRRLMSAQRLLGARRKYAHAWILMDKVLAAGDSAEYLYRYLREDEPDVNTWFVLSRTSADWNRLTEEGFRLLAYGSPSHHAALCEADAVLSTHLDVEMTNPLPDKLYPDGKRPWKYVYLEHGVLQHDLSIWFNRKPIDLMTTASVDEQQSIVEDFSSYLLTSEQAKLTGFPRHDEVARLAAESDPLKRDIVLFAPTWRHKLLADKTAQGELRKLRVPFEDTEFAQNWLALINSPELAELARVTGTRLVFLPHPNFRKQIDPALMGPDVELMTSVNDVHELLTRCRCVVTDYSSIFFEAALAGADVSYFQFDRDDFLHGGHTYVPGYWTYEDHGLGPIALTPLDAVDVLRRQLTSDSYDAERAFFGDRLRRTLPLVDGHSCERIAQRVKDLLGPTA
ncbi:glycosyltransferase [Microbacterium protaetiae]|uniref:Glycosyltransferase n=1 Tax=Microbacterium protaetiae TaxID=2509458 RepID=A0A4V0YDG5_9MICO|nr:glycosyltransferase [Microbacterium protaetiae]QAY60631.1 glycosyltransferase [Microbacterium protaetiae]